LRERGGVPRPDRRAVSSVRGKKKKKRWIVRDTVGEQKRRGRVALSRNVGKRTRSDRC